ncbi:MAG TPA: SurA N-terminal domain-containing protein, partial [Gaiellales bacterium]|nr:SurA N-terminal domain-containing protein [Gaiellales bacterium]
SLLAVLAAAAVGCGGSSSSESLNSGDVAVVDNIHVTRDQLNHRIQLLVRSAKAQGKPVPKAGTPSYQTQVIDTSVGQLVFAAQVKLIADQLGVNVTDDQVNAHLKQLIQQSFGGSQQKYQAAIKKLGLTQQDVLDQLQEQMQETGIENKLKAESPVNAAAALKYYNQNKSQFTATDDTRDVNYILVPDKATAEKDLQKLRAGVPEATVAKGAIDSNSLHQPSTPLKATSAPNSLEKNFQKAALTLPQGQWGEPVVVSKSYANSQLKGRCNPDCYFLIYPTDATQKKGSTEPFSSVKAQIIAQLEQTTQATHVNTRIQQLLNGLKGKTKYAQGYQPPASATTPATTSSTATS